MHNIHFSHFFAVLANVSLNWSTLTTCNYQIRIILLISYILRPYRFQKRVVSNSTILLNSSSCTNRAISGISKFRVRRPWSAWGCCCQMTHQYSTIEHKFPGLEASNPLIHRKFAENKLKSKNNKSRKMATFRTCKYHLQSYLRHRLSN